MNLYILGVVFVLSSLIAKAETTFTSEVLIGKNKNSINSTLLIAYDNEPVYTDKYSSELDADSYAFRFGFKYTNNLSFELSEHKHGRSVNTFIVYVPQESSSGIILPSDYDIALQAVIPIEVGSTRLGAKLEFELFESFSINSRVGVAFWRYKKYTPVSLITVGATTTNKNGTNAYYSVGCNYDVTKRFYAGLEYSLLKINDEEYFPKSSLKFLFEHGISEVSFVLGWRF